MTNASSTVYDVQVSAGGNSQPARDPAAPSYDDFPAALAAIRQRYLGPEGGGTPLRGRDQIDIVVGSADRIAVEARREPRYEFFIDPLATDEAASTGSGSAPWPSLAVALVGLEQLYQRGELAPGPGERVRLMVREPFSTSPVDSHKRLTERIIRSILFCMTMMLVMPLAAILSYLLYKALPVLTASFLFENPRNVMTAGGIWGPLVGTFYLVFFSLLAAAPVGILAGVYLNEYARSNWLTRIVNLAVVNLAGVPSIVHALFGVGAFVMFADFGESVLAASLTLAVMTLPVIITSTKEALHSVPRSFREACWNMGASRWQTIRTIVLPNSISGILTGVILQVSRAAGETAPILFTGAAFSVTVADHGWASFFPYGLYDSCMALSYHLHIMLTQVPEASAAEIEAGTALPLEHLQYGTAVVLIGLVLAVNSFSIGLRLYLRTRKKW
jgi:phosphate transport system permease protein